MAGSTNSVGSTERVFWQEREFVECCVSRGRGALDDRQEPGLRPGGEDWRRILGRALSRLMGGRDGAKQSIRVGR